MSASRPTTESDRPALPDRLTGILLFLPVPVVLYLFTRIKPEATDPAGLSPVARDVALGLVLMATHPLYARPWAVRRASRRCLWCGGAAGSEAAGSTSETEILGARTVEIADPRGTVRWATCRADHTAALASTLRWAQRFRVFLSVGIGGTVVAALVAMLLADRGWLSPVRQEDAIAFFQLGVALTVLPLGWIGGRARSLAPEAPGTDASGNGAAAASRKTKARSRVGALAATSPFPMHVPALVGAEAVLWLFRLIGLVWLARGAFYFVGRLS